MKRFQASFYVDGAEVSTGGTWAEIWANVSQIVALGFQVSGLTIKAMKL